MLGRENPVNGPRKGDLHRTAHLSAIELRRTHHCAKGAHIKEVLAHPLAGLLDVRWLGVLALGFDLVVAREFHERLFLITFQRVAAQHKDLVSRLGGIFVSRCRVAHIIPNLALQANVGDEPLKRLRIKARAVVGVRVSVRIAVLAVKQKDEVVAVLNSAH